MNDHFDWLGHRVRDKITGFTGIAASISFDVYGCVQVAVTPQMSADGKLGDSHWFDTTRLELVDPSAPRVMEPIIARPRMAQASAVPGGFEKPSPARRP